MSIGAVLDQLRREFPDVTLSKLRFLESEGLVSPSRTPAGYRRYDDSDVERLRYVLLAQRDQYLPLKVIRSQLESLDSGEVTALTGARSARQVVTADSFRRPRRVRLTDEEAAERAGVSEDFLAELVRAGLITPDGSGYFAAEDVDIASSAKALESFGLDMRHLRAVRQAAQREADLITQAAGQIARRDEPDAQARAEEFAREMSATLVSLHASVLKSRLR